MVIYLILYFVHIVACYFLISHLRGQDNLFELSENILFAAIPCSILFPVIILLAELLLNIADYLRKIDLPKWLQK